MNSQEKEFKDIIDTLKLLRSIKPDEDFHKRMERKVMPASSARLIPVYALRIAAVLFFVLLSGSGMVAAASQSKPGEILYPVKQAVETVKTTFTEPQQITTEEPTPILQNQKEKHNSQNKKSPHNTSTVNTTNATINETQTLRELSPTPIQPTPTPTPKPDDKGVLPAVEETVDKVIDTFPVEIKLPMGNTQPTSTPTPKNEGSKDNGSDAGAGGSLLPQLNLGL